MIKIKEVSSLSQIGRRPNQEDYICPLEVGKNERIFVLCDGMGGHGHGEVASRIVATSVYSYLKGLGEIEFKTENLQDALDYAIEQLSRHNTYEDDKPMGTTIVVLVINSESVFVGHVGDSRAYLFDENGLKIFRTKDHSKVQEAIDAEILTEEEALHNPKKNLLTRCVLANSSNTILDVEEWNVKQDYVILLCSDGLNGALRDEQIEQILIERTIEDSIKIIDQECKLSSDDNYSVVMVKFDVDDEANEPLMKDNVEHISVDSKRNFIKFQLKKDALKGRNRHRIFKNIKKLHVCFFLCAILAIIILLIIK